MTGAELRESIVIPLRGGRGHGPKSPDLRESPTSCVVASLEMKKTKQKKSKKKFIQKRSPKINELIMQMIFVDFHLFGEYIFFRPGN